MEIDTGASVSIASRETFELIREGEPHLELEEPTVRLQTYTGESIKVCGSTIVKVMHNGQTHSLPLVITEGSGPTLLGRNWLAALRLDWRTIFNIGRDLLLQQVLSQHAKAFREELGKLQRTTANDSENPRQWQHSSAIRETSPSAFRITRKSRERVGAITSTSLNFATCAVL